tara:strand:+ start:409 stop:513 length:105 start_codon:yes stop_codon:yes gene_type:complete
MSSTKSRSIYPTAYTRFEEADEKLMETVTQVLAN